jgi:hypothetical protein
VSKKLKADQQETEDVVEGIKTQTIKAEEVQKKIRDIEELLGVRNVELAKGDKTAYSLREEVRTGVGELERMREEERTLIRERDAYEKKGTVICEQKAINDAATMDLVEEKLKIESQMADLKRILEQNQGVKEKKERILVEFDKDCEALKDQNAKKEGEREEIMERRRKEKGTEVKLAHLLVKLRQEKVNEAETLDGLVSKLQKATDEIVRTETTLQRERRIFEERKEEFGRQIRRSENISQLMREAARVQTCLVKKIDQNSVSLTLPELRTQFTQMIK